MVTTTALTVTTVVDVGDADAVWRDAFAGFRALGYTRLAALKAVRLMGLSIGGSLRVLRAADAAAAS